MVKVRQASATPEVPLVAGLHVPFECSLEVRGGAARVDFIRDPEQGQIVPSGGTHATAETSPDSITRVGGITDIILASVRHPQYVAVERPVVVRWNARQPHRINPVDMGHPSASLKIQDLRRLLLPFIAQTPGRAQCCPQHPGQWTSGVYSAVPASAMATNFTAADRERRLARIFLLWVWFSTQRNSNH